MKRLALPLFVILLFLSCTHNHYLNRQPRNEFLAILNKAANQEKGCILLNTGKFVMGDFITAGADSVRWFDLAAQSPKSVSTDSIRLIQFRDHRRGGIDGLKIGLIFGGAAGSLVPPLISSALEDRNPAVYILPSVAFGGLAGFTVGGLLGSKERFIFSR